MIDSSLLDRVEWLSGIGAGARRELLALAVERRFAAGQILYSAGSASRGMYIVVEGRVRVTRGAGRTHVVHTEGPGGTLGEVPLFEGGGYPATATAVETTRCIVLSAAALRSAMEADSSLAWIFLRRLSARIRVLVERLDRLATHGANARLAALLLERWSASGGAPFTLGGSQTAVAEELGTVREVIVRGLRALRQSGVVCTPKRGWYEVMDADALRRIQSDGRN